MTKYIILLICVMLNCFFLSKGNKSGPISPLALVNTKQNLSNNKSILDHWTPERIEIALANSLSNDKRRSKRDIVSWSRSKMKSTKGMVNTVNNIGFLQNLAIAEPADINRADYFAYPYNSMGKLFFDTPNNGPKSCSATYVGHNRILLTAAHCLITDNVEHSNIVFAFGYNGGYSSLVGEVRLFWYHSNYRGTKQPADLALDYAFALADVYINADPLSLRFNTPDQFPPIRCAGYSDNNRNGSGLVYSTDFEWTTLDTINGQRFIRLPGNYMGAGSNGGPCYVIDNQKKATVVGVMSFRENGVRGVYSPVFNSATEDLFDAAVNTAERVIT